MKKLFMLGFGLLLGFSLLACDYGETRLAQSYVLVEINPEIEFILNDEDEVVSYSALNEDAEGLLEETDIVFEGMDIEDAVEAWLDLAIEAGFLDANREDNVVYLTIVNEDEDHEEALRERVGERARGHMVGRAIGGAVEERGLTMEEFIDEARDLDVSPGLLRMAYAASADGEITLEEALEMEMRELMRIIHEAHDMPNHRQHRRENMPETAPRGRP